jgi:hypothetical protein
MFYLEDLINHKSVMASYYTSRSRENHIGKVVVSGDLRNPSVVALQGTFKSQLFVRHGSLIDDLQIYNQVKTVINWDLNDL